MYAVNLLLSEILLNMNNSDVFLSLSLSAENSRFASCLLCMHPGYTKHCTLYFRCSEVAVHNVQIPISTLCILLWKIYVQSNSVIIS